MELAFIMPIIMFLFVGLIEVSRMLLMQHSVDTAAVSVQIELPVGINSWVRGSFWSDSLITSHVTLLTERPPVVRLSGLPAVIEELKKKNAKKIKDKTK